MGQDHMWLSQLQVLNLNILVVKKATGGVFSRGREIKIH